MKAARLALLALACALPLVASAQWQWLDNSGRKVFSDQPPPPDVPANRILRTGRGAAAAAVQQQQAAVEAPAAPAANSLPRPSGKDKELEAKKKEKEAADLAKKRAEDEKVAAMRAENCSRARNSKATFDSGLRVVRTNEKGEREFLDDAQRAAEVRHLEEVIARDCAAKPQ